MEEKSRVWAEMGGRGHVLQLEADLRRVRRGAQVRKHGKRVSAEGVLLQPADEPERK